MVYGLLSLPPGIAYLLASRYDATRTNVKKVTVRI